MKRCPTCNKTYSDDSMSFCLEDGAPLLSVGGSVEAPPSGFDPNMTIPFTPTRDTTEPRQDPWGGAGGGPQTSGGQQPGGYSQPSVSPYAQQSSGQYSQPGAGSSSSQPFGSTPSGQFPPPSGSGQYQPTPSWTPQPPPSYASAPRKSSALPWVLGGIGLIVVLGIAAAVVIGVLASMNSNTNKNNSNNSNSNSNSSNKNSNSNNSNNSNSNSNSNSSASSGTPTLRDDFSNQKWWTGTVNVGSASYSGSEYRLTGNPGGYIVVYSPKLNDYYTQNARTVVTARSVTGYSPSLGFGLAVYGELKNNQLEDYSFLIRTDSSDPAYRVVLHQGGKETVLVNWTSSSVIRTGSSPNQLEVRASGKQLTFYVNGQYVTSVTDTAGYGAGLVGFYASDTSEIAFDDLEIYK